MFVIELYVAGEFAGEIHPAFANQKQAERIATCLAGGLAAAYCGAEVEAYVSETIELSAAGESFGDLLAGEFSDNYEAN